MIFDSGIKIFFDNRIIYFDSGGTGDPQGDALRCRERLETVLMRLAISESPVRSYNFL